ncbi:coproporphyrinogen-III oxidase family protein [Nonomuraea sp. NPDC049625]|uniref:coproporphyrinogen-III oxidase family protein n=1 Tax=Nonomuraea sp. NPDC049625 TaxID=3155775 RepID=UPI00343039CB
MTKPLLIYANVPFCNSKCHFCDWVVQVPVRDLRLGAQSPGRVAYLEAIKTQIRVQAPALREHYHPDIVYWGGGTASILGLHEIESLYGTLSAEVGLSTVREATIEGSPESLDRDKLRLLRGLGFNRISIGVQSFDDARLRRLGRAHAADQALTAVQDAHEAGFTNINIDLIVGFPGQTGQEVADSVRTALTLPINHFSIYPYRASPGTVLRKQVHRGAQLDLNLQLQAYGIARELLEGAGFPEYAMSYFGHPRCQSDEAYYQLRMDWIGFGSGANSLIGRRYLSYEKGKLAHYNANPLAFDVNAPAHSPQLTLHFLSQALTTAEGLDARLYQERTGVPLRTACSDPEVMAYLERMNERGRVIVDRNGIRLHRDDIAQIFIALTWITTPDTTTNEVIPLTPSPT